MVSPQSSIEQRERADAIFKRGLLVGWLWGWGAIMVLTFVSACVTTLVFHSKHPLPWLVGFGGLTNVFARAFATRRVRRAGLSQDRIERRIVPNTVTQFHGQPLLLQTPNSVGIGWAGMAFSCVLLLILWAIQQSAEPFSPFFVAFGVLFVIFMVVGSIYLTSNPVILSMDTQSVKGSKNGFWTRRVSWQRIAAMEIRQSFDYKGSPLLKTLVFLDNANATLIKVPLSPFVIKTELRDDFVAQVEAHLSDESKIPTA